jgi:hypothetical protein
MTVRQLLRSLDSRELTEWRAFFRIEAEKQPGNTTASPKQKDPKSLSEHIKASFRRQGM